MGKHRDATQRREMLGRAVRFVAVSVLNNGMGYALFALLLWRGVSVPIAAAICYAFAIGLGYVANSNYSFRAAYGSPWQAVAYIALYLLSYVANVAVLQFAAKHLGISPLLTQIVLVFAFGGVIFLVLHYVIFAAKRAA